MEPDIPVVVAVEDMSDFGILALSEQQNRVCTVVWDHFGRHGIVAVQEGTANFVGPAGNLDFVLDSPDSLGFAVDSRSFEAEGSQWLVAMGIQG